MTLVEILRGSARWQTAEGRTVTDPALLETAADLIERLKRYARHSNDCAFWFTRNGRCSCGLTALIKEIEGE